MEPILKFCIMPCCGDALCRCWLDESWTLCVSYVSLTCIAGRSSEVNHRLRHFGSASFFFFTEGKKLDRVEPCGLSKNMFGVDQWWVCVARFFSLTCPSSFVSQATSACSKTSSKVSMKLSSKSACFLRVLPTHLLYSLFKIVALDSLRVHLGVKQRCTPLLWGTVFDFAVFLSASLPPYFLLFHFRLVLTINRVCHISTRCSSTATQLPLKTTNWVLIFQVDCSYASSSFHIYPSVVSHPPYLR